MSKLLTISIAAYNVEQYLGETLESFVIPAIMNDIEVLIVDDGSKDNTKSIGIAYQEKYPNTFKYIEKENGGHGSTINKGITLATGKYFKIVDGDDYVDKTAFLKFIENLKQLDDDIVLSDLRVVNSKGEIRKDPGVMDNGVNPFDLLVKGKHYYFDSRVNTKIFGLSTLSIKTALLQKNNVRITEKCFYVDVEFIIWCIYLSNSFIYLPFSVYMYRKDDNGNNSVSKKNMIKNIGMQEKVALKMCYLYEQFCFNCKNEYKLKAIIDRIGVSLGATYRTYMLTSLNDCNSNIKRIDKDVKNNFPNAYEQLNKISFIKYVRAFGYKLIPFIKFFYNIYINRKYR